MKRFMAFCIAIFIGAVGFAQTGERYALVIGNNSYRNVDALSNPVNDATDIAAKLWQLGYSVDLKTNLNNIDMARAIEAYVGRLASNTANEGFFWYAGHAVQLSDGENYLLPIDINARDDIDIRYGSYRLNYLLELFERRARNKVNVVVLDACRDNPFRNTIGRSIGSDRGLSTVAHVPQDLLILYSTSPGQRAEDGIGKRNSPFAEAFLKYITDKEALFAVVAKVTAETLTLTGQKQRPFQTGSIISDPYYSLNRGNTTPASAAAPAPQLETTGIVVLTSSVPGIVIYNGREQGTRINAHQSITFNGVAVGNSAWSVKLDDGRTTEVRTVMVQAGQTAIVTLLEPAPPVPRNVRAGTPGADSVILNWDSVGTDIRYKVYYSNQNDAARAGALSNLVAGSYVNITGMTSGVTYYFWIASVQNGQESAKSPLVTVRTASITPQLDPSMANTYYNWGVEYYAKKEYDRAIAEFSEAIRIDPTYANAYNRRGWAYDDKGNYDRAIADYTEAIRLNPQESTYYNNRGIAYKNKGDYDRAIKDYTEAIRLNPRYDAAYNNRGSAYYNKGDYDRAIADYDEAIRINPDRTVYATNRGLAYRALGR